MKAIIFDFDGMVYITEKLYSERLCQKSGLPLEEILPFFKERLPLCQLGEADLKEELTVYLSQWGINDSAEDAMKEWFSLGAFDDDMVALISVLQEQGVKCGLCTNNEAYRLAYMREVLGVNELFDFVVCSSEEGVRKPDLVIYRRVLEVVGLEAKDVLICDDHDQEFERLEKEGFSTHLYQSKEAFLDALRGKGLSV